MTSFTQSTKRQKKKRFLSFLLGLYYKNKVTILFQESIILNNKNTFGSFEVINKKLIT